MKKTYGTERGSCVIIIKSISEATKRLATKIMACKLLIKCHKEEVPVRVIMAATQCTDGTMLSLAPYLLNMFLDDCRDAQDRGTKFHYSWILILITLIGWREPHYTYFCEQNSWWCAVWYMSLGSTSDPKIKSTNASRFVLYYNKLQESIANSWRITLEVVMQYRDIVNFKETRHTVWIQVRRDPGKEWLQHRYYVKEEYVEIEIWD